MSLSGLDAQYHVVVQASSSLTFGFVNYYCLMLNSILELSVGKKRQLVECYSKFENVNRRHNS